MPGVIQSGLDPGFLYVLAGLLLALVIAARLGR